MRELVYQSRRMGRMLVVIALIATAVWAYAVYLRPRPLVEIKVTGLNANETALVVAVAETMARDTERSRTRAIVRGEIQTSATAGLPTCRFFMVILRTTTKGVKAWIIRNAFGRRLEPWEGPQRQIIAIDVAREKGWVLSLEDATLGEFLSDQGVTISEMNELQQLSYLFRDLMWFEPSITSKQWHRTGANSWEMVVSRSERGHSIIQVHTAPDDIVTHAQLKWKPSDER